MKYSLVIAVPVLAFVVGCGRRQASGVSASRARAGAMAAVDSATALATPSAQGVSVSDSESTAMPHGAARGPTIDSIPVVSGSQPLVVDRPTLIGFFIATEAQLDSFPDENETLSDFQYYLPLARDSLDRLGVALKVQYQDTVVYRVGNAIHRWFPAPDSAKLGYVLLRPAAEPRVEYGMEVDAQDLVTRWLKDTTR